MLGVHCSSTYCCFIYFLSEKLLFLRCGVFLYRLMVFRRDNNVAVVVLSSHVEVLGLVSLCQWEPPQSRCKLVSLCKLYYTSMNDIGILHIIACLAHATSEVLLVIVSRVSLIKSYKPLPWDLVVLVLTVWIIESNNVFFRAGKKSKLVFVIFHFFTKL